MNSNAKPQPLNLANGLPFYKMNGSGNDFILIDNRGGLISETASAEFVTTVCRRQLSAGADGVILIENSKCVDFKWRFYNSDGSLAEMCGNGARCAARFAWLRGIAGQRSSFETLAGVISAEVIGKRVKIKMTDPSDIRMDMSIEIAGRTYSVHGVNTGVPHAVLLSDDIENIDVVAAGRQIRHHPTFAPAGTNVNFVMVQTDGSLSIRTYERGVEDETLACGTGAVAVALIAAMTRGASTPVSVFPRGGPELTIYFQAGNGGFTDVFLEGDARVVYKGRLWNEALV